MFFLNTQYSKLNSFVAAKFQLWKHAIYDKWRLLALIGYRGYHVRGSPIKSHKYQACSGMLDRKQ